MAALSVAIIAGAFVAVAAIAPIDFTGHWAGSASGKSPVTLSADLTSSGRIVTGTLNATQDGQTTSCTVNGKQKGRSKIKASLTPCKIVLQGKFDAATSTIKGHYLQHGRRKTKTGTFTLTRVASPSGAFLNFPASD
jgi:hypothetical protein